MDSLQATLDFVAGYDLPLFPDAQAETQLLAMIEEERGVLRFGTDVDHSSDDDVSLGKFALVASSGTSRKGGYLTQDDVCRLVESAPRPQVCSQPTQRRRRGASRKDEIAELRKLATELSKKLESMQTAASERERAAAQNKTGNAVHKKLWKGIASRQLALRRGAEADNATLRTNVALQAKSAANLKRMLKRRYSEEMLEMVPIEKRVRRVMTKTSTDNERVYRELLEGTNHVYAGVDALLEKKGMSKLSCPGRTNRAYPETANGLFIELTDKNLVPFSAARTGQAVWKALCGQKTCDGDMIEAKMCTQHSEQTEDVSTSSMSYTCSAAGHSVFVQERRIGRRYIEDDRVVFVCRCLTEPSSRSLGSHGLLYQETVVIVVRRGQTLASGEDTSVIESYLSVTRCDDGKETTLKFRAPTFVNLAINGWSKKLSLYSDRIENILFDDALNTASTLNCEY
ncbi:hypothetical protein PHYPSEUDO_010137 [Phytophthora pseudosyringae]|uniref:M96 mating-specific protein family n=1 Tax=Phytophthora pseudosyringae TaxID=221518 RepID=A0A8T1VBH0_9STRA|nr:hypothetical protein PHYPSEUDO_010137 [Phytophthora pseudosyringae]